MHHRRHPKLLALVVLLTAGGWWGQVLDAVVHLRDRTSAHTAGPHYENPAEQSHSDRCVLARPSCRTENVERDAVAVLSTGLTAASHFPSLAGFSGHPVIRPPRSRGPPVA